MKTLKRLILMTVILAGSFSTARAQCASNFIFSYGTNGLVTFTSTSVLANSVTTVYSWNYGAGAPTYTATGTSGVFTNFTYTANGTYIVTLFISSASPSCNSTFSAAVTITNVTCPLVTNFTLTQGANGLVSFSNTSVGTYSGTTYSWNFGNGNVSSLPSPVVSYTANGTYTVTLSANNNYTPSCTGSHTAVVVINNICNLVAGFGYLPGSPGQIQFNNTTSSTISVTYTWNLGNSNISFAVNPIGTYTANGTYTVTLLASSVSPPCTSSITSVITVTNVPSCSLNANFSATQGTNGAVTFTNTSTGTSTATTYFWNFGNGQTSPLVNTNVTYTANGSYVVTLTASNPTPFACPSTKTLNIVINNICNLVASFTTVPSNNNGYVTFFNTSTGTQSNTVYNYNFGHGSVNNPSTSALPNVLHVFPNGSYTVILTASNSSFCVSSFSFVVNVSNNNCLHTAMITHTVGTGGLVSFNSVSTGTNGSTTYTWNFGDGSSSNAVHPTHTYANGGTHYISLSIRDTSFVPCASSVTQAINITGIPCTANANFSLVPTATAQYWNAIPVYPFNVSNAVWSWGDGNTSTGLYTSHQYSAAGQYSICLSVTVSCGATASTCSTYSVFKTSTGVISVNVLPPATVNEVVGLNELANESLFIRIYPNPGSGLFQLESNCLSGNLQVMNVLGETVMEQGFQEQDGNLLNLDLSDRESGIYFVVLRSGRETMTRKIILNK